RVARTVCRDGKRARAEDARSGPGEIGGIHAAAVGDGKGGQAAEPLEQGRLAFAKRAPGGRRRAHSSQSSASSSSSSSRSSRSSSTSSRSSSSSSSNSNSSGSSDATRRRLPQESQ